MTFMLSISPSQITYAIIPSKIMRTKPNKPNDRDNTVACVQHEGHARFA